MVTRGFNISCYSYLLFCGQYCWLHLSKKKKIDIILYRNSWLLVTLCLCRLVLFLFFVGCWVLDLRRVICGEPVLLSVACRGRRGCHILHLHHCLESCMHLEPEQRSNHSLHTYYPGSIHTHTLKDLDWDEYGFIRTFDWTHWTLISDQLRAERTIYFVFVYYFHYFYYFSYHWGFWITMYLNWCWCCGNKYTCVYYLPSLAPWDELEPRGLSLVVLVNHKELQLYSINM